MDQHLYGGDPFRRCCEPDPEVSQHLPEVTIGKAEECWVIQPRPELPLENLHTNACGDFTLLSREGWNSITGYPEFASYSMNIDSIGLMAAHISGFEEVALLPPCVCFHIEHSLGSGWTPEGEKKLFDRLNQKEILNPEWHVLTPLVDGMRTGAVPTALNGSNWGLAEFELPEEPLLVGKMVQGPPHPHAYTLPAGCSVCALLPEFDLDRLSLWQDRKNNPVERLNQMISELRATQKQTEEYLAIVEEDRENRLKSLVEKNAIIEKLGHEHNAAMEQTLVFLRSVEKDSEDRLNSIHYYQEKLKKAYADHDHNVAYIEQIHKELAAHVKVIADKDAIIAGLNEQLQAAKRPGAPRE